MFSGAYALKLALTGESYEGGDTARNRGIVIGGLATLYGLWLCYAAGLSFLLLTTILFAPATLLYIAARRERDERLFNAGELLVAVAVTAAALFAVYELVTGGIKI